MSDPNKRRRHLLFAIAVLIGAIVLLIAVERASVVRDEPEKDSPPVKSGAAPASPITGARRVATELVVERGPTPVRAFAAPPHAPSPAQESSPLADALHHPERTARDDLAIVGNLFTYYREQFRELPVGNNAEITAALAGDNLRRYAVLPPEHAAINSAGELTDRWGTPYFFHQLAGDLMEVRSSGPDRQRYTPDDLVWPEASATEVAQVAP